ncbi:hypothetical protein [Acinetobacter towneri]|uniref:hypothetical protein n=1 Tax=Acinetobacter towneri TaxID=202956 RepID=UPI0014446278|nr:hypothetical protein [Acinetobacter towneri]
MNTNTNLATMETVQESMGEAYESLQSLKTLVSSYAKNSDILKSLNDVLHNLRADIKDTNEIYKEDEKNLKSLLGHVYDITNEQKHISMQIPEIIKQLDQNEVVQVMRGFDTKANEYQKNLNNSILKINEVFDNHFTKWNNSTSHLEYSNYVNDVKKTHQDIMLAFQKLDLSQLNNSLDSTFEKIRIDIKDVIDIQKNKIDEIINTNSSINENIVDGFKKTYENLKENIDFINGLNLQNKLDINQQLLNQINQTIGTSIKKVEESIVSLRSKVDLKMDSLETRVDGLEKLIAVIKKEQDDNFNKINDLLEVMDDNQKIIIEQTKKKGWFS